MSKWFMWGHFQYLHFNSFPMTWRTFQGEVFWPLQSNFEVSRVPEDSQVPISGVWVSSLHSSKSGVATKSQINMTCNKLPCHHTTFYIFISFFFPDYGITNSFFFHDTPWQNYMSWNYFLFFGFVKNKFWCHSPWCTCSYIACIQDTLMHPFIKVWT